MSEKKGPAKPTPPKASANDSREALIRAAKSVFASKGYEGATVKDLADEAGVNVSLVSYHFGGKENLYRACIESFGLERAESAERFLKAATSKEDFKIRLKIFAEDFLEIALREPGPCKIVMRGMDTMDAVTAPMFKNVFYRIFLALHNFIESAQRSGFLKPELDTEITTGLMFGSLVHGIRSQEIVRLLGKRTLEEAPYRSQFIEQWVSAHTEGIFNA